VALSAAVIEVIVMTDVAPVFPADLEVPALVVLVSAGRPVLFPVPGGMTTMAAMMTRGAALIGTPCEDATDHSNQIEVKPVRTTVDLNSDFVPHDTDQDGQIGLYEWRKNNPGKLSEFFSMDLNGDGFLTPKEIQLSKAGTPQRSAASFMFALNSEQSGTSQPAPQKSSASTTPASASKSAEQSAQPTAETKPVAPSSDPMVSQANYFFKLLDRDKDNSISAEEWKKSRSMRRMFEEASIDLTVTMSQEQFVKHYIAIKKD
jgi:hypothetical protein